MRLIRFDDSGAVRLGVVVNNEVISLAALQLKYPTMLKFIAGGDAALDAASSIVESALDRMPLDTAKLLAPLERPEKFLAIGMNYRKHVEEAKHLGAKVHSNQFWFNKQVSCVVGPFDEIEPGVTLALDYEVELGVVMGKPAKQVSVDEAANHVFGYVVCNDVTARDWQGHSPTFTVGKSFDTHGPIGPWIITADEIPNPHNLALRCFVNGEQRQDGNTSELIFNVWEQISYLSTAFTLNPGDLLATGTPSGVGVAMDPPRFLNPGDIVRCEVEGIGAIENRVRQSGL